MANPTIGDPEVLALSSLASGLEAEYAPGPNDPWHGSPFKWIKSQPSRRVGKIGESLVSGWAAANGFDVARTGDSEADRLIHGYRVEIKFSTLWESGGYKFQQIRDQDYEYCFCLGVSPFDAHAWLFPKSALRQYVIGHMGQHTGAQGADTAWLGFEVGHEFPWMQKYGGRLGDVKRILHQIGRGPH